MNLDLHNHSYYSDGALSPAQLVAYAKENGVDVLALSDHDSLDGLTEAHEAAKTAGLTLIPAVEISTIWQHQGIHVVGLNIDAKNQELVANMREQRQKRTDRAVIIAEQLEALGIEGALAGAKQIAQTDNLTRPHFAQFLLQNGHVTTLQAAFDKYLNRGKPAFVRVDWPPLNAVIDWTHQAGGLAVLAHPTRYRLTRTKLRALIQDFKDAGGDALEVVTSKTDKSEIEQMAAMANEFQLLASVGSDFHGIHLGYNKLGKLPPLPSHCTPVWVKIPAL